MYAEQLVLTLINCVNRVNCCVSSKLVLKLIVPIGAETDQLCQLQREQQTCELTGASNSSRLTVT
jgi:hypothetical protein